MQQVIKQFLKKTAVFLAVPAAVFISLFIFLVYLNNQNFIHYRISTDVHNLVIGDSHVEQAVNDKIFDSSINLSQNSEAYYFSYYKLLGLLNNNPAIKNVYLGFSYHSLSSYYDDFVYGKYSRDVSSRYFYILPFSEKMTMIASNRKDIFGYLKNILLGGIHNLTSKYNKSFLGDYQSNFSNTQAIESSMDKRINFQFRNNGRLDDFSTFNLSYLDKIAHLCANHNAKLILLNTPLQHYYKSKIPAAYIKKYTDVINAHNFEVIDFHNLSLDDSCFIPDGDHLSEKGAKILSAYLNK